MGARGSPSPVMSGKNVSNRTAGWKIPGTLRVLGVPCRRSVPDSTPRNHHSFHENGSIAAVALGRPGGAPFQVYYEWAFPVPFSHVCSSLTRTGNRSTAQQTIPYPFQDPILPRLLNIAAYHFSHPVCISPSHPVFAFSTPSQPVSRAPGTHISSPQSQSP